MRHLIVGWIMAIEACGLAAAQSPPASGTTAPAAAAAASEPYFTNQPTFAIPFNLDPAKDHPAEVQLFLSVDRGTSWQLYSRQHPAARQFVFRARGDGEFWFASRTLDVPNRPPPAGVMQPELRVLVDTTRPQLEFQVEPLADGRVKAAWQAYDAQLASETLRVEYQSAPGGLWKPVSLDLRQDPANRTSLRGETSWTPESPSALINVRAEVRDRAGNVSVVPQQLAIPQNLFVQRPAVPPDDFDRAAPVGAPSPGGLPWNPSGARGSTAPATDALAQDATPPAVTSPTWPAVTQTFGARPPPEPLPTPAYSPSTAPETLPPPSTDTGTGSGESSRPDTAASPYLNASSSTLAESAPPTDAPAALAERSALPPGEEPRMTSSRTFQLEYDVSGVGPTGVGDVELWATTDGARSWVRQGTDADRQSPFDMVVGADGIYGYRIVVVGKNGLASPPPQPGEPADVWVGVDTTKPVGQLTSATYGDGPLTGQLLITWQAADDNLGQRSIALLFSDQAAGPWTTIATGLPNHGQYAWRAEATLPERIYLRLEVRDLAGNLTIHELSEPVRTNGLAPRGRILGVRAPGEPPRPPNRS